MREAKRMSEHTNERTETHACDSISRQKAINTVKKMRAVCDTDSIEDYEALLETAFEVLPSAQPEVDCRKCIFRGFPGFKQFQEERTAESVQNVSDSDLISRKAAIDALEREKTYCSAFREGYSKTDIFEKYNMGLTDGIKAIKNVPSAQAEHAICYLDSPCEYQNINIALPSAQLDQDTDLERMSSGVWEE